MATSIRRSARLERVIGDRALLRRSKIGSRSKRLKPRWPRVLWLSLGIVAAMAALVALGHLHGSPPKAEGADFPHPALATLAEPAVAAVVSLGALTMIAWCVRHLRFEFLAWWPGRIVVPNFVATDGVAATEVERLTASFRDRLGISHLQSPAGVPAAAEEGDFLDVLSRGTIESGNLLGSLFTLLRAAVPAHAYEVKGALSTRDAPKSCGVTIHVVRLPGKGGGGHTVWDTSWDGAVRQAADHATAAILPRTRVCRSPWAGWRRYYLPADLLRDYEQAAECEQSRRYDQALALYYRALGRDPMNHALRLQIGFLQEKLGLYLDALDTYESILTVAQPKRPRRRRLASRRDDVRKAHRPSARRDRDRTLLVTRYRHAVLLGGPGLPHQWRKEADEEHETRRDEERDRLRDRLAPALERLFADALRSSEVEETAMRVFKGAAREIPQSEGCVRVLEQPEAGGEDLLEQLLLLASLHELANLKRRIPLIQMRRRQPLSRAAVRVSSLIVRERLRLAVTSRHAEGEPRWEPFIEQVTKDLKSIERSSGFDRWQEHYNAACIYALPLLNTENAHDRDDVKELACKAVDRLERASERADSAFLASRRDWLISEDPDLRGLRAQPRFKSYEAAYFPSVSRTPQRPREVHRCAVSRYTLDLLRAAAQRWEGAWVNRARDPVTDTGVLLSWWEVELSARRLVRDVALHHRDWRTRLQLLDQMSSWSVEYGFEPVETGFPGFPADGELSPSSGDIEETTRLAIADRDARLALVAEQLARAEDLYKPAHHEPANGDRPPRIARLLNGFEAWWEGLGQPDVPPPGLSSAHVAQLCTVHATLWRRLGELATPEEKRAKAAQELERALAQAAGTCKSVQHHWGGGAAVLASAASNGAGPGPGRAVPRV